MSARAASLVAALLLAGACRPSTSPGAGPPDAVSPTPRAPLADAPAPEPPDAGIGAAGGAPLDALAARLRQRAECNLLSGCAPAEALVAAGPDGRRRAVALLEGSRGDALWRLELARALRRSRDPEVQRWQRAARTDRLWPLRAWAVLGLGWIGEPALRAHGAEWSAAETHPGVRVALLWARALAGEGAARPELEAAIQTLPRTLDIRVELLALEAIAELRLVGCRDWARAQLGHWNLFVLRQAARTVQTLLDRPAIPLLLPLLDHEVGSVRAAALDSLRALSLTRGLRGRADFERWLARHGDPSWPRSVPPIPMPEAIQPPNGPAGGPQPSPPGTSSP